jgi:uncharacterized phage protein (TIGR02216 family)
MAIGLGVLRLSPRAFWGMTLREMAAAMRAVSPQAAKSLAKSRLAELMSRYPDA